MRRSDSTDNKLFLQVNRMEPILEKDCSEDEEKNGAVEEEAEEDLNKLHRHHYHTRSRKMVEAISKRASEPQTKTDRSVSGSSVSETTAESQDAGCFSWFLCGRSWRKNKKKLTSWFRRRFERKAARAPETDPAHSLRDKITLGLTPSGSGKRSNKSFVKERP
ncbi:unnamed protein product [Tetraodon nigroviridis]|uniref:Chromosome 11 SCAF14528, whole genome shotgun sequence n=1 Tax=Tetraodon nigroviridis TaxID=99883 RepID=Q4SRC2_TETNG|nr:unnamed protein product [Tetraodon nigroviridis]